MMNLNQMAHIISKGLLPHVLCLIVPYIYAYCSSTQRKQGTLIRRRFQTCYGTEVYSTIDVWMIQNVKHTDDLGQTDSTNTLT